MPNLDKELVKAFNVNNYGCNIANTNCVIGEDTRIPGKSYITMTFADGMKEKECIKYLEKLGKKTIKEFYNDEAGAKTSFYLDCFPFNLNKEDMLDKENGRFRLKVALTLKVRSNLQAHLALSMAKDVKVELKKLEMGAKVMPKIFDRGQDYKREDQREYVTASSFANAQLASEFAIQFNMAIEELIDPKSDRKYSSSGHVIVEGNNAYVVRDLFNNASFIEDYVTEELWDVGCSLEDPSASKIGAKMFKDLFLQFAYCDAGISISFYDRVSRKNGKGKDIIIPGTEDAEGNRRYLNLEEVQAINSAFGSNVLSNVASYIAGELPLISAQREQGVYAVDFLKKDISKRVICTLFEKPRVTRVGNEYKLEVQSSPHIDKLQAQLQEAQLRAQQAQSYARAAQLRADVAHSHAEAAQSAADTDQTCADSTISRTESIQKRAEAVQKRAKAAEWSAKEARLRVDAVKLRAEAAEWHEKAAQLRQEIEDKEKKREKVREDACRPWDQFSCGSIDSNSSDETDRNRISHDPAANPPIANRLSTAAPSGSNTFGNKKGQGQSDSGQGRIPTPPPFPVDKPYQPAATVRDKYHLPLVQKDSNSSSGVSSDHSNNVNLPSDTTDSGCNSRNSTLPRGSTPPRSGTSSAADKYKQKKSLFSRIFSFLGGKDRPAEDPYQHSISDASASSIVSKDSAVSLGSNNGNLPAMTQGKDSVQSTLSNLQLEQVILGVNKVAS